MDCSPTRHLCPWDFPAIMLGGLPFPSPKSSDPGIESGSPLWKADSLLSEPPGKPNLIRILSFFNCFGPKFAPWTLEVILDMTMCFSSISFLEKLTLPCAAPLFPSHRHNHKTDERPHAFVRSDWFRNENLTQAEPTETVKLDMCMSGEKGSFSGKLYYGLWAAAVAVYFNQWRVNRTPKHKAWERRGRRVISL